MTSYDPALREWRFWFRLRVRMNMANWGNSSGDEAATLNYVDCCYCLDRFVNADYFQLCAKVPQKPADKHTRKEMP